MVKLGFTGVYIIYLIFAQRHRLWELAKAVLTSTHNLCFEQEYEKYQNFLSENFPFLVMKTNEQKTKTAYSVTLLALHCPRFCDIHHANKPI